jgi:hypothetical protein
MSVGSLAHLNRRLSAPLVRRGEIPAYEACAGLSISGGIGTMSLISAMLPEPAVDIVKSKRRPGCVMVLRSL